MEEQGWIKTVKARGLQPMMHLLLDALEPLGPLGAQVLWVFQPVSWLFGWNKAVGEIADALEDPEAIKRLRQQLDKD